MKFEDYFDQLSQMLKMDPDFEPIEIEIDRLPNETDEEAYIRFMTDKGFMWEEKNGYIFDIEAIKEYDPNLAKVIELTVNAEIYAAMDELTEQGLVTQSIDDNGEPVWAIEESKLDFLKEYLSE